MSVAPDYQLSRDAFGRLMFAGSDGEAHQVAPVRAFPIGAPEQGIALVDAHGHELAWIERLGELPPDLRALVEGELDSREFMPVIERIFEVSSFATPSTWRVRTDHGETNLILKGEEDIRRLASPALMISDRNGIHYLIHDRYALDQQSRKILDRFL